MMPADIASIAIEMKLRVGRCSVMGRPQFATGRILGPELRALPFRPPFKLQREQIAMAMDVVDYEIKGAEMQFVEVELDPGEAAVGEAGSMMYMDAGIAMDTVFGDGSASQGGFLGKLLGAGKRLVTGESLFTTVYTNQAAGKLKVAFAAPYPGKILA